MTSPTVKQKPTQDTDDFKLSCLWKFYSVKFSVSSIQTMYFQTSLPNERLNFLLRIIESFENGPFSSSINHNIQNEAKCKTFVTKMRSNGKLHENKELFSYQRLCISARFKAAALDISEKSLSFRQHAIIEI